MQVDHAQQEAALEKFIAAISSGDVQGLVEVLAPDVVLIADGGGLVRAARRPITGAQSGRALSPKPVIATHTMRSFHPRSAW